MKIGAIGLAVIVALLALYGPHIHKATFVFEDDRSRYLTATEVPVTAVLRGRGLTQYTWTVIKTPQAAHALNLLLHTLMVGLVGVLFWRITGQAWIGMGIAAIMAFHPLTVETVAYATSRAELIAAVGAVLALLMVTGPTWLWIGIPGCIWLAYVGKETGMVAAALLPLVLWARNDARLGVALWLIGGTLAVTSAIWVPHIPHWLVIGHTSRLQVDGLSWFVMQAAAAWRLVLLSVWPGWLSVTPAIQPSFWLGVGSLVLMAALLECAWRTRLTAPLFTVGVVWCAIIAAPRFFVRTPLSPFNEHQWYLAMPGVGCVIVGAVQGCEARWLTWRAPWQTAS